MKYITQAPKVFPLTAKMNLASVGSFKSICDS